MQRSEWRFEDYTVHEKLYTGYASTVYRATCNRSRETVVLKSYALSSVCALYRHQIFREVRLHASLGHENVVTLYAAFHQGDRVVMVQEYCDGGDLLSLLQRHGGRLSERVAVQAVLDPFLRVLHYLHSRGIAHRDIKPENILFCRAPGRPGSAAAANGAMAGGNHPLPPATPGPNASSSSALSLTLKLADFGLAIDLREERAVTRAGTLDYMAPEILNCPYKSAPEENKDKPHLHYGPTVDSWAVGVMTYELLVGCPPFYDQSRQGTEARIRTQAPAMPGVLSDGAREFLAWALRKDPHDRPTILDMVHHPWVEAFRGRRSVRSVAVPSAVAVAAPPPVDAAATVQLLHPPVFPGSAAYIAAQQQAAQAAQAQAQAMLLQQQQQQAQASQPPPSPKSAAMLPAALRSIQEKIWPGAVAVPASPNGAGVAAAPPQPGDAAALRMGAASSPCLFDLTTPNGSKGARPGRAVAARQQQQQALQE